GVNALLNSARRVEAATDVVRAVHQDFGLDDRNQSGSLRERRKASQRVGIHVEAIARWNPLADLDDRAPLRKPRTELRVLLEPRAETIEAVGDELLVRAGERNGSLVDLDAG